MSAVEAVSLADGDPPTRPLDRLWAVVLAGGEGTRLRPLVRVVHGDERPKQFAALVGSRSLLRQTLDRVALAIPAARTVVLVARGHARYLGDEALGQPPPHLVFQPEDRDTAAAVLLPAHLVHARDRAAVVAVFPCDHFVRDEARFARHVAAVAAVAARHPDVLVLLGAEASTPDPDYGWIEPGDPLDRVAEGPVRRVRRFVEKPRPDAARAFLAGGWLWNTFVLVATAAGLIEAGRRAVPHIHERLQRVSAVAGTEAEAAAIQEAYALAPANFSRAVLETVAVPLAVSKLPPVGWSDWGTPDRVIRSLREAGVVPPWRLAPGAPDAGRPSSDPLG